MHCHGRILGEEIEIPGTRAPRTGEPIKAYKTKECTKEGKYCIQMEDDVEFQLCSVCLHRYEKRHEKKNVWYGFFDCDYPEDAHIVGSKWYNDKLERSKESSAKPKKASAAKDKDKEKGKEKDKTKEQILELETWFKTLAISNPAEQPAKLRELLRLRKEVRL